MWSQPMVRPGNLAHHNVNGDTATRRSRGENMNDEQVHELLYQALETEIGGQKVYEAAIRCAQHPELR